MRVSKAIVRRVSNSYVDGLTDANLGKPDLVKTRKQHEQYIEALRACGVSVTVLQEDEQFPDSTFVEDPAVLIPECAILTNPGAPSRTKETEATRTVLEPFYDTVERIEAPGALEGGDVLQADHHFFIGVSDRTNERGATQLMNILAKYRYTASTVPVNEVLHLKTGATYLGDNTMLVSGEFVHDPSFSTYDKLIVPDEEAYAVNCLRINDHILMPQGYPQTYAQLITLGLPIIEIEASEFQKKDGSLTCLSLRF